MLLCYDYQNSITNEEEDIIFATKPKKISIKIINLLKTIQYVKTVDVEIMGIDVKTSILEHGSTVHSIDKKILHNKYGLEVAWEYKVYS